MLNQSQYCNLVYQLYQIIQNTQWQFSLQSQDSKLEHLCSITRALALVFYHINPNWKVACAVYKIFALQQKRSISQKHKLERFVKSWPAPNGDWIELFLNLHFNWRKCKCILELADHDMMMVKSNGWTLRWGEMSCCEVDTSTLCLKIF